MGRTTELGLHEVTEGLSLPRTGTVQLIKVEVLPGLAAAGDIVSVYPLQLESQLEKACAQLTLRVDNGSVEPTIRVRLALVGEAFLASLDERETDPNAIVWVPFYLKNVSTWIEMVGRVLVGRPAPERVVIYPDQWTASGAWPSVEKVIDTVWCHLRLPRFKSVQAAWDVPSAVVDRAASELRALGHLVMEAHLNDDSRSGSMSLRLPDSSAFVVTATRTAKENIGDRFALVRGYDRDSDVLAWSGTHLPSSSAPFHAEVYRLMPEVSAVLHVHCKRMTYAAALEPWRTSRFVPDGMSDGAAEAIEIVRRSGFAVLRGHGEIAAGSSPSDAVRLLHRYLSVAGSS